MSDCDSTGGTHAFVPTSVSVEDGQVTECFLCRCGATMTVTGPAGGGRRIGRFDGPGEEG